MKLVIDGPNEKQALFLLDKHKYIAYGGARGGGKSWAVRSGRVQRALPNFRKRPSSHWRVPS